MAYTYKKDFFGKWKRQHGISTSELTRVLNFNSPDKIRIWAGEKALPEVNNEKLKEEDRGWIPLKHILRLCNHYGLKLSDFIENAEEPAPHKKAKADSRDFDTIRMELELKHIKELNDIHQGYKKTIDELMKKIPDVQFRDRQRGVAVVASEPLEHPKKD